MTSTEPYYTPSPGRDALGNHEQALVGRYQQIADTEDLHRTTRYRKLHLLGTGGQGAVYLAHRLGAHGFTRPVALKIFSPESYRDASAYQDDMATVGLVAAGV